MLLIELFEGVIKLGSHKPSPDSPAVKMIQEIESNSSESPFNHRQRVLGDAKIEISAVGNSTVRLTDIQANGSGAGTKALQSICALADKYNVSIKLTAYGYGDTSTETLVGWYEKHGFSITSEDDDDSVDMIRTPE